MTEQQTAMRQALREATQIATRLWQNFYKDTAPQWEVLPDICGVLSQIDNMVAGLKYSADEPVAWRTKNATPPGGYVVFQQYPQAVANLGGEIEPLYTSPQPSKPWVGLDQHDIDVLFLNEDGVRFARYIEAKLKEKNT